MERIADLLMSTQVTAWPVVCLCEEYIQEVCVDHDDCLFDGSLLCGPVITCFCLIGQRAAARGNGW